MKFNIKDSSSISSVSYDHKREHMTIEFKKGGKYIYEEVPSNIMSDMVLSKSKGKYYHFYINGVYPTVKVK